MKAVLMPADHSVQASLVDVTSIDVAQACVGGYVELVRAPREDLAAYVNEEGGMMGLPLNLRASSILGVQIVGAALFFGYDGSSEEADCPADAAEILLNGPVLS